MKVTVSFSKLASIKTRITVLDMEPDAYWPNEVRPEIRYLKNLADTGILDKLDNYATVELHGVTVLILFKGDQ